MPRITHFEIHADDPQRAIKFYAILFGWNFVSWPGGDQEYWLIETGKENEPGIDGGLIRRRGTIEGTAVIAYVCSVDVPSIDDSISTVNSNGGTIVVPKMAVPGVGWLAYAKDTEGNIFGLMQPDQNAK